MSNEKGNKGILEMATDLLSVNLGSHGTLQEFVVYVLVGSVISMTGITQFNNINESTVARDKKLIESFDEAKHDAETKHSETLLLIRAKESDPEEVKDEIEGVFSNMSVAVAKLEYAVECLKKTLELTEEEIASSATKKDFSERKELHETKRDLSCQLVEKASALKISQSRLAMAKKAKEEFEALCGFLDPQLTSPKCLQENAPFVSNGSSSNFLPATVTAAAINRVSLLSPKKRRSSRVALNESSFSESSEDGRVGEQLFDAWIKSSKLTSEFSSLNRSHLLLMEVNRAIELLEDTHVKKLEELSSHKKVASEVVHEEANHQRYQNLREMAENPVNQAVAIGLFGLVTSKYVAPAIRNYFQPASVSVQNQQ